VLDLEPVFLGRMESDVGRLQVRLDGGQLHGP